MQLQSLSQSLLWNQMSALIKVERETTIELLQYLKEVERRRLFAERGFSSLWDMLTRGFGKETADRARL